MRTPPTSTLLASYLRYTAFAKSLVNQASEMALSTRGTAMEEIKSDGTLVTQVDQELDRFICEQLKNAYPDHAILSEEQNTIYEGAEYTWVVDPIDGTTNFARGLPIWGVSIALFHKGKPVAGVVNFPWLHEVFCASLGSGTTRNGIPIHTDQALTLDNRHLIFCCSRTASYYVVNTPMKSRILGSTTYHLSKVADASALACVEVTPKVWDIAASVLLLQEAGGVAMSLDHRPLFPLSPKSTDLAGVSMPLIAAANPSIYQLMKEHIRPITTKSVSI